MVTVDKRARAVTLVCGPPCGGKSSFVAQHSSPEDLVLCIDSLAQQAGSPVDHNHDGQLYGRATKRFNELIIQVREGADVTAWVIRCAPEAHLRRELAVAVKATRSIVLLPNIRVAIDRARLRDGEQAVATVAAVRAWYQRFRPAPFDEVMLVEADGSFKPWRTQGRDDAGVRHYR